MGITVRPATPTDRATVVEMLGEIKPRVPVERRYDWLYVRNPGGPALTWLAFDNDSNEAAGMTSLFPIRLWMDGREVPGTLGGDAWVRPAFRRRGIGRMLHEETRRAMQERGFRAMYGVPAAMNVTPLKNGGSRHICDAQRWSRPLDVEGLRRGRSSFLRRATRELLRPRIAVGSLEPLTGPDPRIDAVWHAVRSELSLAAVRDAAFYDWRFNQSPAGKQRAYAIRRGDDTIGVCALEQLPLSLRLVDLLAPSRRWGAALRAIRAFGADRGSPVLDLQLLQPDGARRSLWRYGFLPRERVPFLVMVREGDEASPCLDPQAWFFTFADYDLDSLR